MERKSARKEMFVNGINERILREISVGGKSGALNF